MSDEPCSLCGKPGHTHGDHYPPSLEARVRELEAAAVRARRKARKP